MSPGEVALRFQKKAHQKADAAYRLPEQMALEPRAGLLPRRDSAPAELLEALASSTEEILRGDWKAFGHLPIAVGDPPRWHWDNFAQKDLHSRRVAFKLDHRAQPNGADIKVIWEPSRWYQLVRLAMAAWLLEHAKSQEKCIEWLHDWARTNPPFTGLNWTSGLETGIRLIQFTWIDSFLTAASVPNKTLQELRNQILPPHVWYTWRYKSFGSSANNHLMGELAGLIAALARWPELERMSAPLEKIAALWEREVFLQFAEDGGNNEQALGYHLFSWEFCWQAEQALRNAGIRVSEKATRRIRAAGEFYRSVKLEDDPWDFGDSDNAWVTPFFAKESNSSAEWWRWFNDSSSSPALRYWWGEFPAQASRPKSRWTLFPSSGYAVLQTDDWFVRIDASPLGYLSMAPHGHLDALHVSISWRGKPFIIDPGTGAYYADKTVRAHLAGWAAHNSPQPRDSSVDFPKRHGVFLWGGSHETPKLRAEDEKSAIAEISLPWGRSIRKITFVSESNSIRIEDNFVPSSGTAPIVTRWKFAPEFRVENSSGIFRVNSNAASLALKPGPGWATHRIYNPPAELSGKSFATMAQLGNVSLESVVSPAFRRLASAACLVLESAGSGPFELQISPG
jgi:hypothetical protein